MTTPRKRKRVHTKKVRPVPPGTPAVRGEQWTITQVCEYVGAARTTPDGAPGEPLARSTWSTYVADGFAPAPLPWALPGRGGGRVWDSAVIVEWVDQRPGAGKHNEPNTWLAAREVDGRFEFWRGPQATVAAGDATSVIGEAATWATAAKTEQALIAAFGAGDRWTQPKWSGWRPMRAAGVALLVGADSLPERERDILRRRAEGASLKAVGAAVGLSHERVRVIERDAIVALAAAAATPAEPATQQA